MPVINLFLSLFKFLLHLAVNKNRLIHVLFMQLITIQALTRTLTRKGIRVSFLPHEKYIIAAAFVHTPEAQKYFPFFSPQTILTVWKNAISKYWSYPHKNPGRPPVSRAVKELEFTFCLRLFHLNNLQYGNMVCLFHHGTENKENCAMRRYRQSYHSILTESVFRV